MQWINETEGEWFISKTECPKKLWPKNRDYLSTHGFTILREEDNWLLCFKIKMPYYCPSEMEKKRNELLFMI